MNNQKNDQKNQNRKKDPISVIPEVKRKRKPKQQKFIDKYRAKLLTAAAVLTFATPAAITAVQDGNFNPLAAIQATSEDDISNEISSLTLSLVNSDGSELTNSTVNPYRQYNLKLNTESNITYGDNLIKVGDCFYINLPQELDYSAIQYLEGETSDFNYSIEVLNESNKKKLRVTINKIINLEYNAFKTEMILPVNFAMKEAKTVTLKASTKGATSNEQIVTIKQGKASDISSQTGIAMKVNKKVENTENEWGEVGWGNTIDSNSVLQLDFSFDVSKVDLIPEDYFVVQLPKQLEYEDNQVLNINYPAMQVVATVDNDMKTMTCKVLRVPQGSMAEAINILVAAPLDFMELPSDTQEAVDLKAAIGVKEVKHSIYVTQPTATRDVTGSVKNLTFDLTDENGDTISQNATVNPYKVYGMNIIIDMGENAGIKQLKSGDYVDLILPSYLDYSYITDEMVNDSLNLKSVGKIIDVNGQKVLRTTIKQVARGVSNTVTFGFKLSVPFDLEQLYNITENGVWREFTLTLKPTKGKGGRSLDLRVKNLVKPELPGTTGDLYSPPAEFLFKNAGRKNEANILKGIYQVSEFEMFGKQPNKNKYQRENYNIYTLVKIEKGHGEYGLQSRWTPKWDKVAPNVDPTKLHWSASAPQSNEDGYSTLPNAGPGNYINAYCVEPVNDFRWSGDGEKPLILPRKGEYRYTKENMDTYFNRPEICSNKTQAQKNDTKSVMKNVMAHSYPFVSEAEMRQYFGFDDNIHLSDMIGATQQLVWDTLGFHSEWFSEGTPIVVRPSTFYRPENSTLPLQGLQLTQNKNSTANMHRAWQKMYNKCFKPYEPESSNDVKITSTVWSKDKKYVTVTLSRPVDSSETGRLIVSTPGKPAIIEKLVTTQNAYSIKVSDLLDEKLDKNHIDINLDITDNDADIEFYAYLDSADSQDVMSCEMNPRKYSDQSSLEFEKTKEKPKGEFEFTKIEAGTQVTIAGAKFTLTKVPSKTNNIKTDEVYTAVGGTDGKVKFTELPAGFYLLEETEAPEGYLTTDKVFLVAVYDNENPSALYKKNDYNKWMSIGLGTGDVYEIPDPYVEIELIKTEKTVGNQEGKKLSDAIFELDKVDEKGNSIGSLEGYPKQYKTDKNGKIAIKHLTNGSYTMKEVKAPEGYKLSDEVKMFTIVKGEANLTDKDGNNIKPLNPKDDKKIDTYTNVPIEYTNELAGLTIKKVSSEDANTFLSGAEFTITNLATKEDIETVTTNENGEVTFKKLAQGYYSIKETKAPDDYKLSDNEWLVYVDEKGNRYEVDKKGSVTVPVAGSELTLIKSKNYKLVDHTTDTGAFDGKLDTFTLLDDTSNPSDTLRAGEYVGADLGKVRHITKIHIKQAPTGHPNDFYSKYEIQYLNKNDEWIKFENKEYTDKEITIETNINAKQIRIVNLEDRTERAWIGLQTFELEEKVTDSNSGADIQRAAPYAGGHDLNTASKIMEINKEEGTYTQYIYINNYEKNRVWFDKAHFKPSAKITLPKFNTQDTVEYKVHKVPANRVTTDLKDFDKLEFSEYTTFPENTVSTSLTQGTDATELVVNFTPKAIPSYEEAHAALIEVTAKYRDGFEEQVSNLDVTSTFEYSPKANSKDKNSATTHNTATIVNYGKGDPITGPIVVENEPFHGLQIKKTDNQGNALVGATFTLTTESGEVVDEVVSDKNGFVGFDNLTAGNYILEETSAPLGYVPTAKKWHITVETDGTIKYKPVLDSGSDTNNVEVKKLENLSLSLSDGYKLKDNKTDDSSLGKESTLTGAFDADPETITAIGNDRNKLSKGSFVEIKLDEHDTLCNVKSLKFKQALEGNHSNDFYNKYRIDYYNGTDWITYEDNLTGANIETSFNDMNIKASSIRLINLEDKINAWLILDGVEVTGSKPKQKTKTYLTEEGSFVKKYQDPGYKCYMLNLASKIIAVDPKAKTFTQYVYVNNWFNSDNNSDAVTFDRRAFRPKVSLKLPKGKITNTKVDVYRVPWYNVGELTDFNLDLTHFEKIKENTDSKREPESDEIDINRIDGLEIKPNMIDIKFGTALAKPITYKGKEFKSNAAVIAVTSTYEGNAITTTSSFQYNNINAYSNELLTVRKVTTTSSAYEFSTEEQEGTVITQPIKIANNKDEIPKPKEGTGQVSLKKTVVGKVTANAKFALYKGRIESLGDKYLEMTSDVKGVIVFNNIAPGVYTLKETKAPDGAIATERTWTVIVSEDGYTEAIENPIEGGSALLPEGGINQAENMIVEKQSFTVYPKGDSDGTVVSDDPDKSQPTIYPNNGGLMNLQFEADFNQQVKPTAGDYFIVDIPDYMHDHGINPADRNQHILANSNGEPIAVGKMVDIVEIDGKDFEVLTKEDGQRYYLVDSETEGEQPKETSLGDSATNRVIKYTFTKYAPRMEQVVLYGDMMLSIDTDIATEDTSGKDITYTIAGKGYLGNSETKPEKFDAGKLNISYPKGGNNGVVSINSCINYKDNLKQEFEYYIYLNPDRIKDPNNIQLSIYDFGLSVNNEVLTSGYDSVADIKNIEFYKVPKEETLPASFGVRHNLPKEKITPTDPEKHPWHKVGNEKRYYLGNLLKDGDSYVVKVTGTMGLQGDSLALSARLTSDANPYKYLNINNWTYLRSNGGGIAGELSDRYPVLDIANEPFEKAEYPKTGSIGSIIFYMIGLTGMIGSAWMFTKKQ